MILSLSSDILSHLQQQARRGAPLEICGLLFGENQIVSGFEQARNIARHANRQFEIDPAALIEAERAARDGGPAIVGYYHSHPQGDVKPSQTDAASAAADERIWLIINGRDASAWRATESGEIFGRFNPIALDCQ